MTRSRKPKDALLTKEDINKSLIEVLAADIFQQLSGMRWYESTIEQREQYRTLARTCLTTLKDNGATVTGSHEALTSLATALATKPAVTVFDFQD